MLDFDRALTDELVRRCFFQRVRRFILRQSLHPAFRAAARQTERTEALWRPAWPRLQPQSERSAAMGLSLLLAADVLQLQAGQLPLSTGDADADGERCRDFFACHRLLRWAAFDLPDLVAPEPRPCDQDPPPGLRQPPAALQSPHPRTGGTPWI